MTHSVFFWRRTRRLQKAALPEGMRIYAVGDIHGRFDCLLKLEARIARQEADLPAARETMVVFLGDYVDRGPASRDVIEHLLSRRFADLPARFLLGNHEDAMLTFLREPTAAVDWLSFGGMATLASYGVRAPAGNMVAMQQGLGDVLPDTHRRFLEELELWIEAGDYLFVHAGIRPNIGLAGQRREDLLTIREPFLSTQARLPWRVVHGHTVFPEPRLEPYRISLDTGAYATGRLSCAVIEGESAQLLT